MRRKRRGRGISPKPLPKNLGGRGGDAHRDRVIIVDGGGGVSPTNVGCGGGSCHQRCTFGWWW